MEPLAVYGESLIETNTNLSRSLSISILNENGNEIPFETTSNPIEFFIPRDPNLQIPSMILTNKTFHSLNLTTDLPISIHFEIKANFAYRFVYKFDNEPIYTNSIQVNQSYFTFMIDNQQTIGHRTLIFGFEGENQEYEYRVYSSGCYYLNNENESFSNSFESLFALLFLLINVMKSLNNWSMLFSFSSFFSTNSF